MLQEGGIMSKEVLFSITFFQILSFFPVYIIHDRCSVEPEAIDTYRREKHLKCVVVPLSGWRVRKERLQLKQRIIVYLLISTLTLMVKHLTFLWVVKVVGMPCYCFRA